MIGVFPQCKEILVRLARAGGVAIEREGASETEVGENMRTRKNVDPPLVYNFLKLRCRLVAHPTHKLQKDLKHNVRTFEMAQY